MTVREGPKGLHPLVHSPGSCSCQSWADSVSRVGAGAQAPGPSAAALPSHNQSWVSRGCEPACIWDASAAGGGLACCATVLAPDLTVTCGGASPTQPLLEEGAGLGAAAFQGGRHHSTLPPPSSPFPGLAVLSAPCSAVPAGACGGAGEGPRGSARGRKTALQGRVSCTGQTARVAVSLAWQEHPVLSGPPPGCSSGGLRLVASLRSLSGAGPHTQAKSLGLESLSQEPCTKCTHH